MGTHHQPYFLEKAKEDLVHHSAAWVVKKPERSPIFVDCHAIEGSRFASRTLHLSRSMSWPRYTGAIRWKPMKWKSL